MEATTTNVNTAAVGCEICGGFTHTRVTAPWLILRCLACGLTFAPQSKTESSPDLYDEGFARESKHPTYIFDGQNYTPRANVVWSRHFSKLSRYRKSGRILDIGCSLGFLLDQAAQSGWEPYGIEISAYAVDYARKNFGIKVTQGILEEDSFPSGFFDAVLCSHVMEHVPSPRTVLRRIRKILRPGGVVLILVPTQFASLSYRALRRIRGVGPPLDLYFFSRSTLSLLLEKEGFCIVQSEMNTEMAHLLGALTRKRDLEDKLEAKSEQMINRPGRTLRERTTNIIVRTTKTAVNRIGTALDFGDELTIYAERRDFNIKSNDG